MLFHLLPNADALDQWAAYVPAEAALPRLMRRLIANTSEPTWLEMATGAATRFPGWDGTVRVTAGNTWVPEGDSYWEMGTNREIRDKANRDYRKRTDGTHEDERLAATFVFVTPRHWRDREDWIKTKKDERAWGDVRAIDASGLEAWLEEAEQVHLWLSQEMDASIRGARTLESWWAEWTDLSYPHRIPPAMLLYGREGEVSQLLSWLRADRNKHVLQGATQDEVIAFVGAVLSGSDADVNTQLMRAVVVRDADAWRQLVLARQSLILIPDFHDPWIAKALEHGHHVIIPVGPDDPTPGELALMALPEDDVLGALERMGIGTTSAAEIIKKADGDLRTLRRELSRVEKFRRPSWSDAPSASLASALLVGSWDAAVEGDRRVLERLARRTYDEFEGDLQTLAQLDDAPVRKRGSVWLLAARQDAWRLLHGEVRRQEWDEFADIVVEVLGEPDPAWGLPADERWMAAVRGKQHSHSARLRTGLATTLGMLGGWRLLRDLDQGRSGPEFANAIARRLLDRVMADESGASWAAVGNDLPLIAEAAPFPFLDAVSTAVEGDDPALLRLMREAEEGGVFGRATHAGVLWGLEALAWSPDLLGFVTQVLVRWAARDPGGRWSNRPANSLREIYLPWRPQTSATVEQRLRALDSARRADRDAAWPLLRMLLPTRRAEFAGETHRPRWRRWTATAPDDTRADPGYFAILSAVIDALIADAGTSGDRWASIVEAYDGLPLDLADRVVAGLDALDSASLTTPDCEALANALRETAARHHAFADAHWALPEERIAPLDRLAERFEPVDVVVKHRWLFEAWPDRSAIAGRDHRQYEENLARLRLDALESVIRQGGWPDVERLVDAAEQPETVGATLVGVVGVEEDALSWIATEGPERRRAALGYIARKVRVDGWEWARAAISTRRDVWTAEDLAAALGAASADLDAWQMAAELGEAVERTYWTSYSFLPRGEQALTAAGKLLEVGRPFEAADVIGSQRDLDEEAFDADLTYRILKAATEVAQLPPEHTLSMFRHVVPDLLDRLDAAGIEEANVAQLEWAFLGLLDGHEGAPKRLNRLLAREPEFFVEVVSAVFRGEHEEPAEADEAAASRARQSYRLLMVWKEAPGADGDVMDAAALHQWVDRARELLAAANRTAIGDQRIGHVLWWAPPGSDGDRPHEAVRDVIETLASEELERGFAIEAFNSRGVHFRAEGGDEERAIAASYRRTAERLSDRWPRTGAIFETLASEYEVDAHRQDERAALRAEDHQESQARL